MKHLQKLNLLTTTLCLQRHNLHRQKIFYSGSFFIKKNFSTKSNFPQNSFYQTHQTTLNVFSHHRMTSVYNLFDWCFQKLCFADTLYIVIHQFKKAIVHLSFSILVWKITRPNFLLFSLSYYISKSTIFFSLFTVSMYFDFYIVSVLKSVNCCFFFYIGLFHVFYSFFHEKISFTVFKSFNMVTVELLKIIESKSMYIEMFFFGPKWLQIVAVLIIQM